MIALPFLFLILLATAHGFRSFKPSSSCSIKTALRARPWYDIYGRLDDVENDLKDIRNTLKEIKNDLIEIKNDLIEIKNDLKEIKVDLMYFNTRLKTFTISYNVIFIISQIPVWYYTLLIFN